MSQKMSEEELFLLAAAKVERRTFTINFVPYILINLILVVIWRVTGGGFPWFLFPLCIWGILLLVHYWSVFISKRPRRLSERRKKLIAIEVWKMKKKGY